MADTITKINNKNLSYYNAELLEFTVSPNTISNNVLTTPFSVIPHPLKGKVGTKKIKLKMDFSDGTGTENNAAHKISKLLTDLMALNDAGQYTELYLRDGYYYTVCFDSVSDPVTKAPWIQQCEFTFVGFRHATKITHTWTSNINGSLSLESRIDRPSPLKIKITPPSNASSFFFNILDQTINFENISNYVEIDSLYSTVKDNDGNAFDKCDLYEFPFFEGNGPLNWIGNRQFNVIIDIIPIVL